MYLRLLAIGIACIASACHSAELSGEQRGEALVEAAKQHLAIQSAERSVGKAQGITHRDSKEVRYEQPMLGRFATYYISTSGELEEFVVNGPNAELYEPVKERRVFIERMMEIVSPGSSPAERAWGAEQLDVLWTDRMHPMPVQVGDYVFRGMTVRSAKGAHDTFWIVAADMWPSAWKYRPRS